MAVSSTFAAPKVRLEVRSGGGRPTIHEFASGEFLIGTVAGCDLRLAGSNLPALMCVITRQADAVHARKLAPTLPLLHNGQPFSSTELQSGDLLSLGPMTILVAIERAAAVRPMPIAFAALPADRSPALDHAEAAAPKDDLTAQRREMYKRYQERRDRLAGLQQSVDTAARNLQQLKRQVETDRTSVAQLQKTVEARRQDLDQREHQVADAQGRLARAKLALDEEVQQLDDKRADIVDREQKLAEREEQHRNDLTRLDRLQATLEQRERQLEAQQTECDRRAEQINLQVQEFEERAQNVDVALARQREHAEQLHAIKVELDERNKKLDKRAADIDGQQSMLAALRARLERTRDEVRNEASLLVEQRARQEAAQRTLDERLQQVDQTTSSIATEQHLHSEARRQFDERSAAMQAAVVQIRQMQDRLTADAETQRVRGEELDRRAAELAEQAEQLKTQTAQVAEQQEKLEAERMLLSERGTTLGQTDESRKSLQEQLHRRAEELAAREKQLDETSREHAETVAEFTRYHEAFTQVRGEVEAQLTTARAELEAKTTELDKQAAEIAEREDTLRRHIEKLRRVGATVAAERKAHFVDKSRWTTEQQALVAEVDALRTELEAYRRKTAEESTELNQQLPDLELRGEAVLTRLTQAREQLHGHLTELHEYARQSQDDLQALRTQVQTEFERMRAQELAVQRDRAEHRLAVTAFRQHLIEWQGRIADMRQMLAHDGTRLEWKQAEVDAAAKQIDATSQQLAKHAAELVVQEQQVSSRRGEMERHLGDMREWYRKKLRELAESGVERTEDGGRRTEEVLPLPSSALRPPSSPQEGQPADQAQVLPWQDDLDPGDRQLGELLRSLELVDADTLTALQLEARRQRRSLRQVLLAGRENGAPLLTLYQMALIEAGNLDGLVLGPLRVVDRLHVTPRETVYRVFDPRRGGSAVLRHLTDVEAQDPAHANDFRARFTAMTAVQHANLAGTLEILEINGRPAVLQEWLTGLPSSDWPAAAAVPGVWYRLMMQCALGLRAAHDAGIANGHLAASSVVLTSVGVLKLVGFGEPQWLCGDDGEASMDGDLTALGRLAAAWAALAPRRRGNKPPKPLPAPLLGVLNRLQPNSAIPFTSASELLDALERAGANLADASDSWDALLEHTAENVSEPAAWRKSA